MKRQIFIVGTHKGYACWMEGSIVYEIEQADLVVFTGGEDVSPALYGHEPHPMTVSNPQRDNDEVKWWRKAMDLKIPMVGICRGAQFLCVMAGGKLVQHQDNPKQYHMMTTYDDQAIMVNSLHHQAMYPWNLGDDDFRVLGWTVDNSKYHEGEDKKEMVIGLVKGNQEVEVCYFPHIRSLCIQSHPEMMYLTPGWGKDSDTVKTLAYFRELLNLFMTEFPNAK